MGIALDESRNLAAQAGEDISAERSHTRVFVVETNEELVVARKAMQLLLRNNTHR